MDSGQQLTTKESLAQKPDWWPDSSLNFSRYSNKELKISLSNIFHILAVKRLVHSYWLIVCHLFMNRAYTWFLSQTCKCATVNAISKYTGKLFFYSWAESYILTN